MRDPLVFCSISSVCAHVCLQVPEAEREVYEKGQHLRGADAEFSEQTRAEMVRWMLTQGFGNAQTCPHQCI